MGKLLCAGRMAEVRGGASDIMDVAFEQRILRHLTRLFQNALMAARLHDPPLMEGERAECALAETSAVARDAEAHFLDCRHAARLLVDGMISARIGQAIHSIELFRAQGFAGCILNHEQAIALIGLDQLFPRKGIDVAVLHPEAFGIFQPVSRHRLPGRQGHGVFGRRFQCLRTENSSGNPGDLPHLDSRCQGIGDRHDSALPHAVEQQIGSAVEQNRSLQLVGPVIIVGQAAQRSFHPAQNDGDILKRSADQLAVHHRGVVWAQAHFPARRIAIAAPALLRNGVMIHHGIHVAGAYQESKPGAT